MSYTRSGISPQPPLELPPIPPVKFPRWVGVVLVVNTVLEVLHLVVR